MKQCDALTKLGCQCRHKSCWEIPNIISGTGVGRDDWVYGRPINLCRQHAKKWHGKEHGRHVNLIKGGVLQCYNDKNYGSIVLSHLIDWNINYSGVEEIVADVPEYWRKS